MVSNVSIFRVENNLFPVVLFNGIAMEFVLDPIVEHGLLVKSNVVDSDDSTLLKPDDILGDSIDLESNLNTSFDNKEDLFDLFNSFKENLAGRLHPWF